MDGGQFHQGKKIQEVGICSLVISLYRKGLVCHQCKGFRLAERLHTSQRTCHSGPSGSRVGQTDRRTRGHSIHRKLRNPSRPRCWTYAHGTETAQASRHERRIDISWRHTFLASMGKAVASLFISRFERKMRTGDGRGTSSLGAEQNSTQRGRPSRRMDNVHKASFHRRRRRMEVSVRRGPQVLAATIC